MDEIQAKLRQFSYGDDIIENVSGVQKAILAWYTEIS